MSESKPVLYPRAAMEQWLGSGAPQSSYNLDEYLKLIEPTYQVYENYIRKCVAGLTTIAAQRAASHQEDDIPKLRQIVLQMVPFWGLDGGIDVDAETSRRMEMQYKESFDQAVLSARHSGTAPSFPDGDKESVLIALEIHRQELESNDDLDDWIDECVSLKEQLQSEWQMNTDSSRKTVPQMGGMNL